MRESPGGRSPSGAGRFLTQGYKDFSPNVMMLCCAGVCSLSATARLPGPLHRGAPKPLAESQWVKRVVHPRSTSTENMRTFVSSKQLCNSIFKFVEWRLLWGTERRGKNHVFPKMCSNFLLHKKMVNSNTVDSSEILHHLHQLRLVVYIGINISHIYPII